jgi:hypothetical protein
MLLLGAMLPLAASANIGLPMIAVFLPPLWVALVPIVLVESAFLSKGTGASFRTSLGAVAVANVTSTIIGVPLLWFVLATIEAVCCGGALGLASIWTKIYAVTVQAPWLIPYEDEFDWMIPAALCTLAVVFMVMSVFVETPIVSRITKISGRRLWTSMWAANIGSYILLGLAGVLVAALNVKMDQLHRLFMPLSEAAVEAVFFIAKLFVKAGS